jgi:hypothetical protein
MIENVLLVYLKGRDCVGETDIDMSVMLICNII